MQTCVNINGTITSGEQATISVFDHGFLYGDSVYEAFRTYSRRIFLYSRHYERLEHSARGIYLRLPVSRENLRREILRTIEASSHTGEFKVRVIVTRGIGDIVADPDICSDPKVIIFVVPLPEFRKQLYSDGVQMTISSIPRGGMVSAYKTGNLMHQVLATREAKSKGAYDAILLTTDGYVSDGIACNIYMVQGSTLKTPGRDAAIIEGITKGAVLDLAREIGMEVVEGLFTPDEINRSSEMFLTSTYREVVPIVRVDDNVIGNGRPGPWTTKIIGAYQDAVDRLLQED